MTLYTIFETTVVTAAVAGGGLTALHAFAPSIFRRLFGRKHAHTIGKAAPVKAGGCSACDDCGACGRSKD
jgi:hypothetical protein